MSNNTWSTSEFQTLKDFGILHPMFIAAVVVGIPWGCLAPSKSPVVFDASRFHTNRDGRALALPTEGESFTFAVYGDRTGATPDSCLTSVINAAVMTKPRACSRAVRDTNLAGPDLVMTVGDLIQGYNTTEPWLDQMREYRETMNGLLCPWFPVAGNHDIYWRGPDRPAEEHEQRYEQHFGRFGMPLTTKGVGSLCSIQTRGIRKPESGISTSPTVKP